VTQLRPSSEFGEKLMKLTARPKSESARTLTGSIPILLSIFFLEHLVDWPIKMGMGQFF
jgi:hypothetical protein